ncbi:MAG: cereblon family protein [bacterium]
MGADALWQPFCGNADLHLLRRAGGEAEPGREREGGFALQAGCGQGGRLVCWTCGFEITSAACRARVLGRHVHTFANPHGYVYRIGCFTAAPGCLCDTGETSDFTWFAGYVWSIEVCGRCQVHMGWRFRRAEHIFHGLVLDRLVEEEARPSSGL